MLYTKRGDDGTTKTFGDKAERILKCSEIIGALGAMDEVNSFIGLCKVKSSQAKLEIKGLAFEKILHQLQQSLFIIQAELAGADKTIEKEKIENMEKLIDTIEQEMPPIKTFFISGGSELGAMFDVARTLARRAERKVLASVEAGERNIGDGTKAYLNRLSSLLYALARLSNHKSGIKEEPPSYM